MNASRNHMINKAHRTDILKRQHYVVGCGQKTASTPTILKFARRLTFVGI